MGMIFGFLLVMLSIYFINRFDWSWTSVHRNVVEYAKSTVVEAAKSSIDYTFAAPRFKYNTNLSSIRK